MDAHRIVEVLSGRDRSVGASLLRSGLSCAAPFYGLGVRLRNLAFDRGWRTIRRVPAAVISIGNLTTGGTGKTPLVAWITNFLAAEGHRPAIVSRGYRSLDKGGNDEKRLMDQLCPGTPHLQNPSRFEAASTAIAEHSAGTIVLDDAFQHRQLHRDLDVVLIDALQPWGFGHLLPRGLLREPEKALARASIVILTRCEQTSAEGLRLLRREVAKWTSAPIVESTFRATGLVNFEGERLALDSLPRERVAAFCGIGNPEGFRRTLAEIGLPAETTPHRTFPDHHHYSTADVEDLARWAQSHSATALLTTRKDLVKIPNSHIGTASLWGVDLTLAFVDSAPLIERLRGVVSIATRKSVAAASGEVP